MSTWKDYIKMHSTESKFVIGPSNILFAGVYMCTFQPINFTGWGSEGVKLTTCTVCRWGHPVRLWFQLLRVCGVPWRGRGVGATTSWVLLWPSRGTGVMRWCPRCRVDTIRRRLHLGLRRIWYGGVPVVCWHGWWSLVWGFSETECVWLSWVKTLRWCFVRHWIYCPFFYSSARSQLTQSRVDFSVCIKIFQYIGPEVWNFLPLYVRHSSSLSSFK